MSNRSGLTLMELLVALAVGAVAVLIAHGVLVALADARVTAARSRSSLDRNVNGRRLLASLLSNVEVTDPSATGFRGTYSRVTSAPHLEFASWLEATDGLWELRTVRIKGGSHGLLIETELPSRIPDSTALSLKPQRVEIDYLPEAAADDHWVAEWSARNTAPIAVRLRTSAVPGQVDTALFLVGVRG